MDLLHTALAAFALEGRIKRCTLLSVGLSRPSPKLKNEKLWSLTSLDVVKHQFMHTHAASDVVICRQWTTSRRAIRDRCFLVNPTLISRLFLWLCVRFAVYTVSQKEVSQNVFIISSINFG